MKRSHAIVQTYIITPLDQAVQALAWGLGKFTRIAGLGAFWHPTHPSFWDAWTEPCSLGGGSLTLRMGRLELIADWRA